MKNTRSFRWDNLNRNVVQKRSPRPRPLAVAVALLVLLVVAALAATAPHVAFASFAYSIPIQRDQLTIEADGKVKLLRYFEFSVSASSSDNGTEIWAGLPTAATKVTQVLNAQGNPVKFSQQTQGGNFILVLKGFPAIKPGTKQGFTVSGEVPDFLFEDSGNPTYVTLQYIPGWWSAPVDKQEITFVLPSGVTQDEVRTGTRQWDAVGKAEDGRLTVFWRAGPLSASEKILVGAGFPAKYVTSYVKKTAPPVPGNYQPGPNPVRRPSSGGSGQVMVGIVLGLVAFGLLASVAAARGQARREPYSQPRLAMDGVGANKNLSVFEAATLLREEPGRVLTMVLFELCRKNLIRVVSKDPLKVERLPAATDAEAVRQLSAPEKSVLKAIDEDGTLDGESLVAVYLRLARQATEKTKPYCRKDTETYYHSKAAEAWAAVEAAGTPEVRFSEYDKNLLWCLLDKDAAGKTERMFPQNASYPVPANYWFWRNFMGAQYFPYQPYLGYSFFHTLNRSYYDLSGQVAPGRDSDMQQGRDAIFNPPPPISQGGPRGGAGGFVPPPSCACACACVSCACACACAGGGGCT